MSLGGQKNVITRKGNNIKCVISPLERVQKCCVVIEWRAYSIHFYLITGTRALLQGSRKNKV